MRRRAGPLHGQCVVAKVYSQTLGWRCPVANTSSRKEGINAPGSGRREAEEPPAASSSSLVCRNPQRKLRILSRGTCSQEVKNPLAELLPGAFEAHKEAPAAPPSAGRAACAA